MNIDLGIGTPFVHLKCDISAPVTPRDDLAMSLIVAGIGRSSITHDIEGRQLDRVCFKANFVSVFVRVETAKPISIPKDMRANIERFADQQGCAWTNDR